MSRAVAKEAGQKVGFLTIGFGVSLMVHGLLVQSFFHLNAFPLKPRYGASVLVPVMAAPPIVPPRKPEPLPEKKPPVKKKRPEKVPLLKIDDAKKIKPYPPSHIRKENAKPVQREPVKPVFGVTDRTVSENPSVGIGVRTGNTLFKEQEKEVTKRDQVTPYVTTPSFELSTLPVFKKQEIPRYPPELEKEEIEGEVLLSVTIDEKGVVVDVAVKKSDHDKFSEAAVAAMFKSSFSPGLLNGAPVVTRIDIPVKFLLED